MSHDDPLELDSYVERWTHVPDFCVGALVAGKDRVKPEAWTLSGTQIAQALTIQETDLGNEVKSVSRQMGHWTMMAARARRIWQTQERFYRTWRDRTVMELCTPPSPEDPKWKKPPEHLLEAMYRTRPDYAVWQLRIEQAEEAYNMAVGLEKAFAAKHAMLRIAVMRVPGESAPRLTV